MKSRTSFFNGTILKKDITRFAPVWGIYSVILLLYLLALTTVERSSQMAYELASLIPGMASANGVYGFVCALFLFSDLFNPRLCNAQHAMPLRREGWFLTHCTSGLLFGLVPYAVMAGLSCCWLGHFSYMAAIWLIVAVLQYLFFFGVGVFSAMCAGNRLGMLAVYSIINFLSMIVYVVVESFFMPTLKGVRLSSELFEFFCPLWNLSQNNYVAVDYNYDRMKLVWQGFLGSSCAYLGVCAAIGAGLCALALLVYRKRKLENAGDFLAVKPLSVVFLIIYTLGIAVFCYQMGKDLDLGLVFLAVGLIVGFFTGRMFLERKVNVFKPKSFLGFGVFVAVLALLMGLSWMDIFGIAAYVPKTEQIESVRIFDQTVTSNAYKYIKGLDLTEPEELEEITAIHKELTQLPEASGMCVTLVYQLKDGRTVRRYYEMEATGPQGQRLKPYFSRWQYVFGMDDWAQLEAQAFGVIVENYANNRTLAIGDHRFTENFVGKDANYLLKLEDGDVAPVMALLEAVRKDCDAGNMAQAYDYMYYKEEDLGWIELHVGEDRVIGLHYNEDATNIVACLEKLFDQSEAQ